ncbi:hypothetical protein BDW62DRAFT_184348 [Aspergillus aurantiobrunneus]
MVHSGFDSKSGICTASKHSTEKEALYGSSNHHQHTTPSTAYNTAHLGRASPPAFEEPAHPVSPQGYILLVD